MIRTIWVVNHAGHNIESAISNYRPAHVEYLSEGNQNLSELDRMKYNMYQMFRSANGTRPSFDHSQDAILLCGNTLLNVVAAMLLVTPLADFKSPYLRFLIWDGRRKHYYLKDLDLGGLRRVTPDQVAQYRVETIKGGPTNEQG